MTGVVSPIRVSVVGCVLLAAPLSMCAQAQSDIVFLPPVRAVRPIAAVETAESAARLTPALWQPTGSNGESGVSVPSAESNAAEADETSAQTPESDEAPAAEDESDKETGQKDDRSYLDSGDSVLLDGSGQEEADLLEIFRFNESALEWTLRGSDVDGVGFFTLRDGGPSWQLEFDSPAYSEIDFTSGINFVSGPSRPGSDLPERLYDFAWNVHSWTPNFIEIEAADLKLGLDVNFDLGIHTDFEDSARDGWRFPGRVLLVSETDTPGVWLTGGFEYLDLEHIQMLPAGGLVLRDEDASLELFFPRPRISLRLDEDGNCEEWLYVMGEYRGRGWAIERSATGLADVATLSEYRLAIGLESVPVKDTDEDDDEPQISFFEVSWLFGRDLEFDSGLGNMPLHDTVMFRLGSRW